MSLSPYFPSSSHISVCLLFLSHNSKFLTKSLQMTLLAKPNRRCPDTALFRLKYRTFLPLLAKLSLWLGFPPTSLMTLSWLLFTFSVCVSLKYCCPPLVLSWGLLMVYPSWTVQAFPQLQTPHIPNDSQTSIPVPKLQRSRCTQSSLFKYCLKFNRISNRIFAKLISSYSSWSSPHSMFSVSVKRTRNHPVSQGRHWHLRGDQRTVQTMI